MEMIDDLQNVIVDENDSPVQGEEVVITRCGQLEFKKKPKKEKLSIKGDKELEKSSEDQIPPSSRDPDPSAQRKGQIDQNDNKDPHRTGQHGKTQQPSRPRRRSASRQDVPEVILKGRGAMKYKEHHSSRRNKSPDYGRLR
ncbi:hypothetical protein TRICI_006149 [Trichomonascus ciferrii]|uniref:Uncharacterized protein n=1 Tax=Trichomonascus ciferrii TaxID=44093 RepID=A0A642UKM9_9ASCO|nr:hypothetical protein TRICI_006149 [Trichomonascus ciferrii]